MSQLKLFLFGAPKVELNGNVVDLQRRKAMAMLVYLTMTRQSHRRDVLALSLLARIWAEDSA
ncbi:hypothetical protein KFU94_01315 [Chloroflexi bacterium TSY]|nr:hypothetical protein [Chloroflexi bacterium TSY]